MKEPRTCREQVGAVVDQRRADVESVREIKLPLGETFRATEAGTYRFTFTVPAGISWVPEGFELPDPGGARFLYAGDAMHAPRSALTFD